MPDRGAHREGPRRVRGGGLHRIDRLLPVLAVAVSAVLFIPGVILGAQWGNDIPPVIGLVPLILCFLAGWRVGGWLGAALVVVLAVGGTGADFSQSFVSIWVFTVPAWVMGEVMRSRDRLSAQLAQRGRDLDAAREAYAQESVRYERARIARDLHDIVAHNLSLIVVQAAAGRRVADDRPEVAIESLRNVERGAAAARREIDQLVALLVTERGGGGNGLAALRAMLTRAAGSGLSISYGFTGDCDGIPTAAADAALRATQEGITNALKHAPGAPIRVEVAAREGRPLTVTVENGPADGDGAELRSSGGGFGLAGLRERIAAIDGNLDAGPTSNGGWRVVARVPVRSGTLDSAET